MRHEEFAERVAGRPPSPRRWTRRSVGSGATPSPRANEMRVAAHMVRDASETVTRAEEERRSA